jgi:signal transduction histidine kinase
LAAAVGLIAGAGEVARFRPETVPRALLDRIVTAATALRPGRLEKPPWRVMVVVGEERERLVTRIAEALARHWGLGALGPRGLAAESVLAAPALVLVFSTASASEGLETFGLCAGAVQSMTLLARASGLGTHRVFGVNVVPEAALDYAATFLGPEIRGGELVALLAIGWPASAPQAPGRGARATWVGGDGDALEGPPSVTVEDLKPPAAVLRSPRRERVMVADFYAYNRAFLEAQLARAGYAVEVFDDGESLLERVARGGQPDLFVFSDTLRDTTGFELVRRLGQVAAAGTLGAQTQTPVVITTARRDSVFRIAGLSAGVDYYLRKPVNAVELFTAARILLERHRLVVDLRGANAELERLLDELRTAQARLVQQAKMAALGQLVAGVAHEINTPLAAVVSNNDLFLRCFARMRDVLAASSAEARCSMPEVVERDLGAIEALTAVTRSACTRITEIVRTLRTFARLDEADVKAVDLHEGLESTLVLLQHLTKGGITVVRRYGALPRVECHSNQINQVFMNLLVNACQAMGEDGTLTISTRALADEVEVRIADTGCGIPEAQLGRIFDPGFTTKGAPLGTGLGLSIVYQIVEGHGGEITVESELGRGTAFTLRLPPRHVRAAPALGGASPPR